MRRKSKISLIIPMDFFEWSPMLKTELGNFKEMFIHEESLSTLIFHVALIAVIFVFIGILTLA